jgi:hypothetical protein
MKAKITNPNGYKCAPEGHTIMHFDAGAIVEGVVAEMAILDGHAMAFQDVEMETKVVAPDEIKVAPMADTKADTKKGRTRK